MPQYITPFKSQELVDLEVFLNKQGFTPHPFKNPYGNPETVWARRITDVTPVCGVNDRLSLHISISEMSSEGLEFVTMEIRGELPSDFWADFKFYALSPIFVRENLDLLSAKLIRAWSTLAFE